MVNGVVSIIVFVTGLLIGSFLNVCIYRLPRNESVVYPASHCPKCGRALGPAELIPVVSYLLQRGRCRTCRASVSPRYPLVELLTALVFWLLYHKYGFSLSFAATAYFMSVLLVVFFIDYEWMIIPDQLVMAGLAGAIVQAAYHLFRPVPIYGDAAWWSPLLGMFVGSGFLLAAGLLGSIVFAAEDAIGGGDIKIMAPIGIFLGWKMTVVALFLSVITAGAAGVVLLAAQKADRKKFIPLGPFIVGSVFLTLMWGWDILHLYLQCFKILN